MLEQIHPENPTQAINETYKTFVLAMRIKTDLKRDLLIKNVSLPPLKSQAIFACRSLAKIMINEQFIVSSTI
jgi:hypothetical protein